SAVPIPLCISITMASR
ncbi:hypothetical protein D030_3070B, partial [Vibrio parahaemolyticus AQ3810]